MKSRTEVRWMDAWTVVKASAEQRLGRPLLKTYLLLAVAGVVAVAISVVIMRL